MEKDIPELPRQRNISDRDQFIGIFYSNGNVKIVHDKNAVFDLNITGQNYVNITGMHEKLSENSLSNDRYKNPGFVILDKNPIFYNMGFFTSYQFPRTYMKDFSLLSINPAKIRELLLPSHNIVNISGLMKLKYKHDGKIRFFSDDADQIDLIKKLFKNATVVQGSFSDLNHNTGDGLNIKSYSASPNIRLNFKSDASGETGISASFIKYSSNVKAIIADSPDLIIITYTAYENSALLFKSSEVPLLIIDDGNPNIKKLKSSDRAVLYQGIQYDLKKYNSVDEVISAHFKNHLLIPFITDKDIPEIEKRFTELINSADTEGLFNSLALVRLYLNSTDDRKFFSALKNISQNYSDHIDSSRLIKNKSSKKLIIIVCDKYAVQIAADVKPSVTEIFADTFEPYTENHRYPLNPEVEVLSRRIIHDRERLAALIDLFYSDRKRSGQFDKMNEEIQKLKKEIINRKDIYNQELFPDFSKKKTLRQEGHISVKYGSDYQEDNYSVNGEVRSSGILNKIKGNKNIVLAAAALVLILLAIAAYDLYNEHIAGVENIISEENLKKPVAEDNTLTVHGLSESEQVVLKNNNVKIREIDIYHYANDVAVKNGYEPISYSGLKEKNPNWIYPTNIFVMLDGERIMVRKGNTLWGLSRKKLERMNLEFYTIVKEIKSGTKDKNELLKKASELAYLKEQKEVLERLKSGINND